MEEPGPFCLQLVRSGVSVRAVKVHRLADIDDSRIEIHIPVHVQGLGFLGPDAGVQHGHHGGMGAVIRAEGFDPFALLGRDGAVAFRFFPFLRLGGIHAGRIRVTISVILGRIEQGAVQLRAGFDIAGGKPLYIPCCKSVYRCDRKRQVRHARCRGPKGPRRP